MYWLYLKNYFSYCFSRKKYECPHCNESFTHKAHMKEHIKNSHGDKVIQKCDLCEKTFSTSTILQSHIRTIHEGIYDYKCKYCEKGFGMIGSLNWHIKTVHDNDKEDTNLKCNSCGEQFASRFVVIFTRYLDDMQKMDLLMASYSALTWLHIRSNFNSPSLTNRRVK